MASFHILGPGEIILIFGISIFLIFHFLSLFVAVTVLVGSLTALYLYLDNCNNYWRKQGIPSPKGNIFFGNALEFFKDIVHYDEKYFKEFNSNAFGSVYLGAPDYSTTNLDFIKQVLIKEFDAFPDLIDSSSMVKDSLRANFLTVKNGDEWRRIRQKCTPAFTSGKMRKLLPPMNFCAKELCGFLEPFAENGKEIPLKETFSKLTMNVIGRCVFASNFNSLESADSDNALLHFSKKLIDVNLASPAIILLLCFPNLCNFYQKITKRSIMQQDVDDFFIKTLTEVMEQRQSDPEAKHKYNDAVQLLLNAMEEEDEAKHVDADIVSETLEKAPKRTLTKMEILAQLVLFLVAGYETTATTLHFITYLLAQHPDIQEKVRDEVNEIFADGKDEISYDDISKFVYMNAVIDETLRVFSPAPRLSRLCQRETEIEGIKFKKGSSFGTPVYAIHHSPEIYENPEEFIPERFLPEEKSARHPMAFIPFGAGPRNCLGMRFAEYEIRVTLAWIIKEFKFIPANENPSWPLEVETGGGLLKSKHELKCKIVKL